MPGRTPPWPASPCPECRRGRPAPHGVPPRRHRFDHGLGLFDGFVQLARSDQQLPFHGAQHRDAAEAHFGRVERGDGREGLLDLLVERPEAGSCRGSAARRCAGACRRPGLRGNAGQDQCLSEELVIPLVGGVEPVGRAGQLHRLVGRGVHAVGGHFVIGRCVGRVVADGLGEEFPRPDRIVKNGILFDASVYSHTLRSESG